MYTLCQPLAALTKNTAAKKGEKTTTSKRILLLIYLRTVKDKIQRLVSRYKISALLQLFLLERLVNLAKLIALSLQSSRKSVRLVYYISIVDDKFGKPRNNPANRARVARVLV